jgi:hypothetical protein
LEQLDQGALDDLDEGLQLASKDSKRYDYSESIELDDIDFN